MITVRGNETNNKNQPQLLKENVVRQSIKLKLKQQTAKLVTRIKR